MQIEIIYNDRCSTLITINDPTLSILDSLKRILSHSNYQCLLYKGSIINSNDTYATKQVCNGDIFDLIAFPPK